MGEVMLFCYVSMEDARFLVWTRLSNKELVMPKVGYKRRVRLTKERRKQKRAKLDKGLK